MPQIHDDSATPAPDTTTGHNNNSRIPQTTNSNQLLSSSCTSLNDSSGGVGGSRVWRLSVELYSLKLQSHYESITVACECQQQKGGSNNNSTPQPPDAFSSSPPFRCLPNQTILVPNGWCSYAVTCTAAALYDLLQSSSLHVTLLDNATSSTTVPRQVVVPHQGTCRYFSAVMLQPLFTPPKQPTTTTSGQQPNSHILNVSDQQPDSSQQSFRYLRVILPLAAGDVNNNNAYTVSSSTDAENVICINLYLEDLGAATTTDSLKLKMIDCTVAGAAGGVGMSAPPPDCTYSSSSGVVQTDCVAQSDVRRSQAVAFSLELWKQSEQAKFSEQLQQKETDYLQAIEQRERQSSSQRQQDFENKRSALVKLEEELKCKARELQAVVAELHDKEDKLSREKELLEGNTQRWKEDFTAAYRRLQADCEQTVKLDRQRYADLADRKQACDDELDVCRRRTNELSSENFELKRSLYDTPMANLQSDLKVKTFELEDLKTKLAAVSASKDYYMNYCQQLLKRLKTLGDRSWQEEFRTRLTTFKDNINHLQSIARQQPELFSSDDITTTTSNNSVVVVPAAVQQQSNWSHGDNNSGVCYDGSSIMSRECCESGVSAEQQAAVVPARCDVQQRRQQSKSPNGNIRSRGRSGGGGIRLTTK
eukprot:GHVS01019590.1.p1 GENE.GHVS01019590.1~~GHVS01019590.1.p1  ORF type:complete len:649 (-),score=167.47 GHVS01019590.1:12-1958(-)